MEATKESKIALVQRELEVIANSIYLHTIKARAARRVDNKQMEKISMVEIEMLEKLTDVYEEELAEISK